MNEYKQIANALSGLDASDKVCSEARPWRVRVPSVEASAHLHISIAERCR